jgi:hypothetical protein
MHNNPMSLTPISPFPLKALSLTDDKVENEVDGLYVTLKNQHKTNTYFPSSSQVRASLKV